MAPNIIRRRIFVAAAFIQCLLLSSICVAENTATLVMMNGNVITGWVKGVDQGKLSFGTDDLGTLSVNWDRVAVIGSSNAVLVHTDIRQRAGGVNRVFVLAVTRSAGR